MSVRNISWRGEGLLPRPLNTGALRYAVLTPASVNTDSIHHTTGLGLPASATVAQEITYIRNMDYYHRTRRGLDAIGYQIMAFASGRVYITAPLDRYGAAVALQNNHTISIALPGDFSTKPPSAGHLAAAAAAVAHVDAYLARKVVLRPHYYWNSTAHPWLNTACPGATYPTWAPRLRPTAIYYTVKSGDTAYSIARAHALTFARLTALNPKGPIPAPSRPRPWDGNWSRIYPGDRVRVR